MSKLLVVSANPRQEQSRTYKLTKDFVEKFREAKSDLILTPKNLAENPVPHYNPMIMAGIFTEEKDRNPEMKEALDKAKVLNEELREADYLVFSMPMYNFNIPSLFKAYIDNIVLPGFTFKYNEDGAPEGLLKNKKCLIISSRGGVYTDTPFAQFNHFETYFQSILGFIGITDVQFVIAEGVDFLPPEEQAKSLRNAEDQLSELAKNW